MQRDRPFDIIRLLRLDEITLSWSPRQNGYELSTGGSPFGFVRYNVRDTYGHIDQFAIYAYASFDEPLDDPHGLFANEHADDSRFGWVTWVDPGDGEAITRVVGVLRSVAQAGGSIP